MSNIIDSVFYYLIFFRALTTFKLEGEVTSLSESSQGEVGGNTEKWADFWEKLTVINRNIVPQTLLSYRVQI
jgi:hypothetical protein